MARKFEPRDIPPVELRGVDRAGLNALSRREREVLTLAASGLIDKQICIELGISQNTLRTYWTRIRSKVGEVPRSALAVAYAEDVSSHAVVAAEAADWELDLELNLYRRLSERSPVVTSELGEDVPFSDIVEAVHPSDRENLVQFIEEIKASELNEFTFKLRLVTPLGIETTSSFVRVKRDPAGEAIRLIGTRASAVDFSEPPRGKVDLGYWERDLKTGKFTADENFCRIFRIDPLTPDLRAAALARFHPDEAELTTSFVDNAAKAGKRRTSATHRLLKEDGSYRWITTDLRVEYADGVPIRALGTVMAFDQD